MADLHGRPLPGKTFVSGAGSLGSMEILGYYWLKNPKSKRQQSLYYPFQESSTFCWGGSEAISSKMHKAQDAGFGGIDFGRRRTSGPVACS